VRLSHRGSRCADSGIREGERGSGISISGGNPSALQWRGGKICGQRDQGVGPPLAAVSSVAQLRVRDRRRRIGFLRDARCGARVQFELGPRGSALRGGRFMSQRAAPCWGCRRAELRSPLRRAFLWGAALEHCFADLQARLAGPVLAGVARCWANSEAASAVEGSLGIDECLTRMRGAHGIGKDALARMKGSMLGSRAALQLGFRSFFGWSWLGLCAGICRSGRSSIGPTSELHILKQRIRVRHAVSTQNGKSQEKRRAIAPRRHGALGTRPSTQLSRKALVARKFLPLMGEESGDAAQNPLRKPPQAISIWVRRCRPVARQARFRCGEEGACPKSSMASGFLKFHERRLYRAE